jgi:hypothetical protein
MKKLLVVLMGVLLVLACSGTVLGEDSPTSGTVDTNGSAFDSAIWSYQANKGVRISILGFEAYDSTKMVLPYNTQVSEYFDVDVIDANGNPTHEGVTLTFNMGNLLNGATGAGLVHILNRTTGAYELVPGTINGSLLTVTLPSTSPCAFYVTFGKYAPVVNTGIE